MKRCLQYLLLLSLLFGQKTFLGGTPYSAPMAKVRENGGEWTVYNIGRDCQGSITHLATSDGTQSME